MNAAALRPAPRSLLGRPGLSIAALDWDPARARPEGALLRPNGQIAEVAEVPALLVDVWSWALRRGVQQVWLTPALAGHWTPGPEDPLAPVGWSVLRQPRGWWWSGLQPGVYGRVSLAWPDQIGNPFAGAASAVELLHALRAFAETCGTPFLASPGATGVALLRKLHSGRHATDLAGTLLPEAWPEPARANTESAFMWARQPASDERRKPYLHSLDKNGMYLAAVSSLALGLGNPVHWHSRPFDDTLPGYWYAAVDWPNGAPSPLLPDPLLPQPRRQVDAIRWYTTPTLAYAYELGATISPATAWVWPEHHRVFEPWYKMLRDARTALQAEALVDKGAGLALGALKATYATTLGGYLAGGWMRQSGQVHDLFRPDWRHQVIAQARAVEHRQLRALLAAGVAPIAVCVDAVYWLSDEPDPLRALPAGALRLGTGLGQWKVKDAGVPWASDPAVRLALESGNAQHLQIALASRRRRVGGGGDHAEA